MHHRQQRGQQRRCLEVGNAPSHDQGYVLPSRALVDARWLRAGARNARSGPPWLLPEGRCGAVEPGDHHVRDAMEHEARLHAASDSVLHESRRNGGRGAAGGLRRESVPRGRGGRGREISDRDVGAADLRVSHGRVAGREGAAAEIHGVLDELPEGGGSAREGHVGHFPRAPVRQSGAVRDFEAGGELGDARVHDSELARVLRVAESSVPRGEHRVGRAEQRGGEEIRSGRMVPRVRSVPRAGVVQQLHGLSESRDGDSVRRDEEEERGEEVRAHAELDAVRADANAVLHSGELSDERGRGDPRGAAAVDGRNQVPAVQASAAARDGEGQGGEKVSCLLEQGRKHTQLNM